MRVQDNPFHCIACKHEWIGQIGVGSTVEVFAASVDAFHCPKCGAGVKQIGFGRGYVPEPQPVVEDMPDTERRAAWLRLLDNGASSECIADVMCGLPTTRGHPVDGQDLGRCERLLILYPVWRARLAEMARVSAAWAALVARWDEIAEAWRHDVAMSREPGRKVKASEWRCYPLLREVLEPVEAAMRQQGGVS